MNVDVWQIIIGIGQIIAVAVIPLFTWWLGVKYQDRKAKKEAQLRVLSHSKSCAESFTEEEYEAHYNELMKDRD